MLSAFHHLFVSVRNAFAAPTDPTECPMPLERRQPVTVDFDGFIKGIDNVHIDVRLSPHFAGRARHVVASMLDQHVGEDKWGVKSPGPTRGEWEEFRGAYAKMVEAVIHRAKAAGQPTLVSLVQFASLKYVIGLVQAELELRRQGFRARLASGELSDAQRVQITDRLTWLARNRARLRYQVNRQLVEQIAQVETGPLREFRRSLLGATASVSDEVLFNPLLQAESTADDDVLMKAYVLLAQTADSPFTAAAVEEFLPMLFRRRVPVHQKEITLAAAERSVREATDELERFRRKQARVLKPGQDDGRLAKLEGQVALAHEKLARARTGYLELFYAWADSPRNADVLVNPRLAKDQLHAARKKGDEALVSQLKAHLLFQHRVLEVIDERFLEHGLATHVLAAYATVPLYREYQSVLSPQELYQFLAGETDRRELMIRMRERAPAGKPLPDDALLRARKRLMAVSRRRRMEYISQFLKDYLTYRRDLSIHRVATDAMNKLHILEDPEHIRLSRDNRTLYEFLSSHEEGMVARTIVGHVIVKADLRGSTTMIAELRNRGLNPASHFSLNFFDPIRELLDLYGARMVFIEGDAIILSLVEHEEAVGARVAVARACGMARELLSVVERQNVYSRQNGLPELEVGIGVVYSAEAPSFLYAGETQIMVSPAIGRADRLSSCSWLLRKHWGQRPSRRVDVFEIPPSDPLHGEKGEVHVRYNVNGIELDRAAFEKLQSEIVLQRVEASVPGDPIPGVFYSGRYPDLKGVMHQLVVREGVIRFFNRIDPSDGKPTAGSFYEIVAEEVLTRRLADSLTAAGTGSAGVKSAKAPSGSLSEGARV